MTDTAKRGNCAEVAFSHVLEHPAGVVCHGYPIGRGPENGGKRFWHAWVETPAGFVIDKSNGLNVYLPREVYYRAGRIQPRKVLRYTHDEAIEQMLAFKHYGPWDGSIPAYADWGEDEEA